MVPAFTIEQKKQFDTIVEELFEPLMKEYVTIVEEFIAGYKKLFPKHLEEDAQRMCQGFSSVSTIQWQSIVLSREGWQSHVRTGFVM